MSLGSKLACAQMAELAGNVTEEQVRGWVEDGSIPAEIPEPGPWPQNPRIALEQVFLVRALGEGRTVEEGRAEVLANGRVADSWTHRPPTVDEQEKTRRQVEADRKRLFQEIRHGGSS